MGAYFGEDWLLPSNLMITKEFIFGKLAYLGRQIIGRLAYRPADFMFPS